MPRIPSNDEFDTTERHSLAYQIIGITDRFVTHPSAYDRSNSRNVNAVRIVEYENGSDEQSELREALISQDLILGSPLTEPDEERHAFRIPHSARSLSYEAKVKESGSFSYDDEQLFYDMGDLVARLFEVNSRRYVLAGEIGRLISLVEFTKPGTRPIAFVPGVEKGVVSLPQSMEVLEYYQEKLDNEVGDRFEGQEIYFKMGFSGATEQ